MHGLLKGTLNDLRFQLEGILISLLCDLACFERKIQQQQMSVKTNERLTLWSAVLFLKEFFWAKRGLSVLSVLFPSLTGEVPVPSNSRNCRVRIGRA